MCSPILKAFQAEVGKTSTRRCHLANGAEMTGETQTLDLIVKTGRANKGAFHCRPLGAIRLQSWVSSEIKRKGAE